MNSSLRTPEGVSRRRFLETSARAGIGLWVAQSPLLAQEGANVKKRFANVGVGSRSIMYQEAINKTYADNCEMVGYCDVNEGRLRLAQSWGQRDTGRLIPVYGTADFERMIAELQPDTIIVTSPDSTHHEYIVRGMELGCDIITEKPMTTTAETCRAVLDAQKRTGRQCRAIFNLRYAPPYVQIKELLMSGAVGDILSVDFHWLLNTMHGADYFRRWHSRKEISGGLLVHKSTHHFDLVNWWLSAVPATVMAVGKREYYTPQMARRMGLKSHHERCLTCPEKTACSFHLDLAAHPLYKQLYLDNESFDGYYRDRCVWRPDIDIEDSMNLLVSYDDGVLMTYSLNAFSAWEGFQIVFNGTRGRLEHSSVFQHYERVDGELLNREEISTRIIPLRGAPTEIDIPELEGHHVGADEIMLDHIFLGQENHDPLNQSADQRSGAYSLLTGIAANHSFASGRAVGIEELAQGIEYPDYTTMPDHVHGLPMPRRV